MKFQNTKFNLTALFLSVITVFSFSSCSSDDSTDDNNGGSVDKPFALSLAIQGSDNSFTYYTVPFAEVMTGTLNAVGEGIEQPGYYDFTKIDNTIYSLGGLDDVNVVAITQNSDSSLEETGDVSFTAAIADFVKGDDNNLISVSMRSSSDVITFRKFTPNTLVATETIDIPVTDITDLSGPNYSGMAVSGDYLFLSYYISNPNTFDTDYTEQAEIAVFSYPELEFQKIITDSRVGPIGGFNIKSGLVKDDYGNVYALSHSNPANGYSQSTKPGGILKINAGESDFDADYFLDIPALTGGKQASHLKYLGGNKIFAEINMTERSEQEKWSDSPLQSAVIDLSIPSIEYINGVPEHKGDGRRLAALQDGNYVYLCVPIENDGIYVYKMDIVNYTSEKGAKVEANFVAGFFKF
ncbi:DUF4374 domain-containing protein [Formosa sediminum]|uniref:DUF4374 domain-containing protein n=1 Tax=Formosa sediminum TaxID=2594004 RepID=A0A516GRT1_9FLAO|nr:DUF4374 domain-containing protein [Formosa sediminum]QDO94224.1 DUF4374 domain-containing protein [Formosa sediminum]